MPMVWADIHKKLVNALELSGRQGNAPPVPLILNGWVFTSDVDKKERWDETLAWTRTHSLEHLVPPLEDNQRYAVSEMTTSVRLTFCPGSYRDLWEGKEQATPESILCPECGATLQPTVERYEAGDKLGQFFAYIPSHDRAE